MRKPAPITSPELEAAYAAKEAHWASRPADRFESHEAAREFSRKGQELAEACNAIALAIAPLKVGDGFRVKSGKLYLVGRVRGWDGRVQYDATQWQVNEKHPAGRYYGPSRIFEAAGLEKVDAA